MAEVRTEDVRIVVNENQPDQGELSHDHNIHMYDPNRVPADLDLAKKHGKAKKVYASKLGDKNGKNEKHGKDVCVCCGLPAEGESIPLTAGLDKLYHLGSGFALYFRFIKYSIGLLILFFVSNGIFNLISNKSSGDCSGEKESEECADGYILSFAISNKRDSEDLLTVQLALNLLTILLIMLFFHYLRYQFRKTEIEADDRTITPSDYTIVIENAPPQATRDEIEEWLQDFATEEMPLKIERIVRPHDIHIYIQLVNRNNALLKSKQSLKRKDGSFQAKDTQRVEALDVQIKETKQKLEAYKKDGLQKCAIVYVTFASAQQCSFIQSKFKRSLLAEVIGYFLSKVVTTSNLFQGVRVKVKRAPEPTDIMWENLGYTKKERYTNRFYTFMITGILIAASFGLIILVNWIQVKAGDSLGEKSTIVQILSIVASLIIVVTNTILAMTIDFLARYEKHFTYTYYLKGVAEKLAVAQFFNTALTNLFAELILADSGPNDSNRLQAINFYGKGGLLEGMYWVFITNAFLTPAMTIFDPTYIMKRVMQYLVSKKGLFPKMTQKEVNQLYEGPAITMPAKYATMIKLVLITAFYAPAMPFVLIFTIIGLLLCYWTEKYVLLRRNALPNSIDDGLADSMVELLEWAACTFAVGNIIYVVTLKNSNNDLAFSDAGTAMVWIGLGISLFHIVFPMELLNKKLFPIKDLVTEHHSYEEIRVGFSTDYDIENPLTRIRALKAHILRLKKGANDDQKKAFLENLDHFGNMDMKDLQQSGNAPQFRASINFGRGATPANEDDQIDYDYLDSYAKQLEVQGSKLDQGAAAATNGNGNQDDNADLGKDLMFGKLFGSFAQSPSQNQKMTEFFFPTVNDRTPQGTLGTHLQPNPILQNLSPGQQSPNLSSLKSNHVSNVVVNEEEKELESIVNNLFNVSEQPEAVQPVEVEKKDSEAKRNSKFKFSFFGNGKRSEEETNKSSGKTPEIKEKVEDEKNKLAALQGIQQGSKRMLFSKDEKKKPDNDDSANVNTSQCDEDSQLDSRKRKVLGTLSIQKRHEFN